MHFLHVFHFAYCRHCHDPKRPCIRVLDLWQVEADFERFLKQFVRDELQSICELVRSSGSSFSIVKSASCLTVTAQMQMNESGAGIAIKKITNKTSRFARACEEAGCMRSISCFDDGPCHLPCGLRHGWCA